jgi:formate dehydrogenase subunit gamma
MFHPALFFLSDLVGGGTWARILHPFIGIAMFIFFIGLMVRFWNDNMMQGNDWQWMRQWRDVVSNHEENLPEVGRYNAGQKLMFWLMVSCMIVLFCTGLLFWRPYFADAFPIWVSRAAVMLHAFAATVFIIGIVVHVYAAIWVKGSFRAMIRGSVTEAWAIKHHSAWYRKIMR